MIKHPYPTPNLFIDIKRDKEWEIPVRSQETRYTCDKSIESIIPCVTLFKKINSTRKSDKSVSRNGANSFFAVTDPLICSIRWDDSYPKHSLKSAHSSLPYT